MAGRRTVATSSTKADDDGIHGEGLAVLVGGAELDGSKSCFHVVWLDSEMVACGGCSQWFEWWKRGWCR